MKVGGEGIEAVDEEGLVWLPGLEEVALVADLGPGGDFGVIVLGGAGGEALAPYLFIGEVEVDGAVVDVMFVGDLLGTEAVAPAVNGMVGVNAHKDGIDDEEREPIEVGIGEVEENADHIFPVVGAMLGEVGGEGRGDVVDGEDGAVEV